MATDPISTTGISELTQRNNKLNTMFDTLTGQVSNVTGSLLNGSIPEDVQAQVRQLASENAGIKGLGFGQGGRALGVRDLGLTSLQLQQQGLSSALQLQQNLNQAKTTQAAEITSRYGLLGDVLGKYHSIAAELQLNDADTSSVSGDYIDFMKELRKQLIG